MARVNLNPNPSLKYDAAGYAAVGAGTSIARVITTAAYYGDACLAVTKGAVANAGVSLTSRIAVAAGTSYAVSVYVFVPAGNEAGIFSLETTWYTALSGGTAIVTSYTTSLEAADGFGWVRLTGVIVAPSGAVGAVTQVLQPLAGTAGQIFYVDAFIMETGYYVGEYFNTSTQAERDQSVRVALTPVPEPIVRVTGLKADISLGNLVFNTIDEDGVVWVITDIDGWWSHPEPDMRDIPRGYGDGSYDVRGRYQARIITLIGTFLPPAASGLAKARGKLIAATDLVYTGEWLKTDESPTKAAYVRLSGKPMIQTTNARGRTDFSIGLRAADPLKYEWWEGEEFGYRNVAINGKNVSTSATGAGIVSNIGNAYTSVIMEVTGPLTGPATIYNTTTGEFLTIISSLRATLTYYVNHKVLTGGVATLTTSAAHAFIVGDVVTITNVDAALNGVYTITSMPSSTSFTYSVDHADITSAAAAGNVVHAPDVIGIDTLNHEISFNGDNVGYRSMVDVLADWTLLAPGDNLFNFYDTGDANSMASLAIFYRSAWLG